MRERERERERNLLGSLTFTDSGWPSFEPLDISCCPSDHLGVYFFCPGGAIGFAKEKDTVYDFSHALEVTFEEREW